MKVVAMAASMGGHVRVGLESSLWLRRGELALTDAHQVRQIIAGLRLNIASPGGAREILSLKGDDKAGSDRIFPGVHRRLHPSMPPVAVEERP